MILFRYKTYDEKCLSWKNNWLLYMISRLSLHNNISRLAWIYNNINTHRRNDVFARSHHIYISQMNMLILIYTRHSLLQIFLEICIDCKACWIELSKNDQFIHSKIDFDIGKWMFDWQHRQDWIVDKGKKEFGRLIIFYVSWNCLHKC